MKNLLSQIKHNVENYVPALSFRDGQRAIVTAFVDDLRAGITSMYIDGPTGIGKTFIEAVIADAMIGDSKDIKILLLTKASLTEQIQKELKRFLPHRRSTIYCGTRKNLSGEIVVMSYASYRKKFNDIKYMFSGLLLDESHKAMGQKTRLCITEQKERTITVGLTASAFYSIEKNLKEFLGKETKKISIKEAIEMNMLCAVELSMLNLGIVFSEKETRETSKAYDYRIANESIQNGTNNALAHFYAQNYHHLGIRSIFFCLTKKQADDMAVRLFEHGVPSRVIHSGLGKTERRKMLASFKKGHFEVLIGIDIPKEGFDDPGVSLSMFCYPARSFVDVLQGNGRVLRLDPNNPNKLAYIIMPNFIGKKGQRFYYEFLDGYSFLQPKDKRKRGVYKRTNKKTSSKKITISPIVSISYTHEEFVTITSKIDKEIDLEEVKIELAKHGIVDWVTLMSYGSDLFRTTVFLGKCSGQVFARKILSDDNFSFFSADVLKKIAKKLGWKEPTQKEKIEEWKQELAKHGIVDWRTLIRFGNSKFNATSFGYYGEGNTLAGKILERKEKVVYAKTDDLEKLAKKLGWKEPTQKEKIEEWKQELAKHGIVSYETLITFRVMDFNKTVFGSFGKGAAFCNLILGTSINHVSSELLEKISEKLGWNLEKTDAFKIELAKHGIVSYETLMSYSAVRFSELDFGIFGKAKYFISTVTDNFIGRQSVKQKHLEKIAKKLNWKEPAQEEKVIAWKQELAKHGIVDYMSLFSYGTKSFKSLRLGKFGIGQSFLSIVLTNNSYRVSVNFDNFLKLSNVLNWKEPTQEEKIEGWKQELANHGIVDWVTLMSYDTNRFKELHFGPFAKTASSFLREIFGVTYQPAIDNKSFKKLAFILGWN